jgi:hypothetical protein
MTGTRRGSLKRVAYIQSVVDLALLAVVAISEVGALLLKNAGPPLIAWVLHIVLDNALSRH